MDITKKSFGSGREAIVVNIPGLNNNNYTYVDNILQKGFVYGSRPYEHYGWQPSDWVEDAFFSFFEPSVVKDAVLIPYTHRWRGKNVKGYFYFFTRTDIERDRPELRDSVEELLSDGGTFDVEVYRTVRGIKTVNKKKCKVRSDVGTHGYHKHKGGGFISPKRM